MRPLGKSYQGVLDSYEAALSGKKVVVCSARGVVKMELVISENCDSCGHSWSEHGQYGCYDGDPYDHPAKWCRCRLSPSFKETDA